MKNILIAIGIISCLLACNSKARIINYNVEQRIHEIKQELEKIGGITEFEFKSSPAIESRLSEEEINSQLNKIIQELKIMTRDYPENNELYYILGVVYMRSAKVDKAIKSLEESHKLGNNSAEVYHSLCVLYWASSEYGKAHNLLEKWEFSSKENNITRHVLDGITYFNEGKYYKAIEKTDSALSIESINMDARLLRGYSLFMLNRNDDAQKIFDEVILDEPAMQSTINSILSVLATKKGEKKSL